MNYPSLSLGQKQIENAFAQRNYQTPRVKQRRGHFQGTNNLPLKSNFYSNEITKCDQCEYKTSKYDLMYSHVRVKHSDLKIKCTECKFSHPFPTKVKAHYKQVHLGVKRPHRRYICRKKTCQKFDTTICTNLEFHSLLFCDKCDFTSGRGDDFKFHTESVHDGIVYKCEYCSSYTAKRKGTLNEHILHKHSIRDGKEFKQLFSCNNAECKFETQYGNTLKKHIELKHEGIVRYKCDFMNCNYGTNESKCLKEHSFLHNGVTPHRCDSCDKMFTRLREMTKHKKKQHIGTDHAKPQNSQFQTIKSIVALIKPEIVLIKDEFDNETGEPEKDAVNLEKGQKPPDLEEKAGTENERAL